MTNTNGGTEKQQQPRTEQKKGSWLLATTWAKEKYKSYSHQTYIKCKEWLKRPWWFQENDPVARFTGWVAAYTCVLVIVSALQFCTLNNTDRATQIAAVAAKKSADSAVIVQQPYVFVNIPKIVEGPISKLEYSWTNYGPTPAILRLSKGVAYIPVKGKIQEIGDAYWNGWDVLRPNESRPRILETREKFEIVGRGDSERRPFFWIEIMYLDIFKNMHVSGYTFFLMQNPSGDGSVEFVAIAGEKYNYHRVTEPVEDGELHYKFGTPPAN